VVEDENAAPSDGKVLDLMEALQASIDSKRSGTKSPAKKAAAKKAAAPKSVAKRAPVKKAPARKAAVTKATVKKAATLPRGTSLGRIVAGFTANDAEATIKWYCDVLGFKVIERWEHEGQFMGAQIGSGDVLLNIGQDDWKQGKDRAKGAGTRLYISMGPDVDGYAAAIKARGGTLSHEPRTEWNMRAFSLKDPDGYNLTFLHELGN